MAWSARSFAFVLSSALMPEAFRVGQQSRNSTQTTRGYVEKLYTWGAVAVQRSGFLKDERRSDGCWQGLRIVNINADTLTGTWHVDIVNGITNVVGFWHPNQPTVKMDERGNVNYFPCGDDASQWLEIPSVSIHLQGVYEERADTLRSQGEEAVELTRYFVVPTYMQFREAAEYIKPSGWKMVGSATWETKDTHLMQHPSSMDCILSFQGITNDRVLDWWDSLQIYDFEFCGSTDGRVHGGFRDQLMAIVRESSFQEQIRSKLPKCREVTAIGHSLGGALAALYSYCINAAPAPGTDGWEHYKDMEFTRSLPEVLPPIA